MNAALNHGGPDESSRLARARRMHRNNRRVFSVVCGLLVTVLALSLLSWSTVQRGAGSEAGTVVERAESGEDKPGQGGSLSASPTGQLQLPGQAVPDRPTGEVALLANPLYETGG